MLLLLYNKNDDIDDIIKIMTIIILILTVDNFPISKNKTSQKQNIFTHTPVPKKWCSVQISENAPHFLKYLEQLPITF